MWKTFLSVFQVQHYLSLFMESKREEDTLPVGGSCIGTCVGMGLAVVGGEGGWECGVTAW